VADPPADDVDEAGKTPDVDEGKSPDGESPPSAEEPRGKTYTEAYVKQLRSEQQTNRIKISELEEQLQELADERKSELERTTEERDRLRVENESYKTRDVKIEVAAAHGLGLDTLKFLTGSTKEEIELHAEELAELLKTNAKPTTAGFDGGARKTAQEKKSPEEEHNDFLLKALGRPARR
jgi:hypothetical protein